MSRYDSMPRPFSLYTYNIQGIYVTNEEAKKMSKDVGFGIRIEDAVLVTADGGIVMTGARAKSPYEPQIFERKLSRLLLFKFPIQNTSCQTFCNLESQIIEQHSEINGVCRNSCLAQKVSSTNASKSTTQIRILFELLGTILKILWSS